MACIDSTLDFDYNSKVPTSVFLMLGRKDLRVPMSQGRGLQIIDPKTGVEANE